MRGIVEYMSTVYGALGSYFSLIGMILGSFGDCVLGPKIENLWVFCTREASELLEVGIF